MALPDSLKISSGTPKAWKSTGGDYAITLASLADGAARQGAKGDLGALRAREYAVLFTTSVASAAANGKLVELWWAGSPTATAGADNPSGVTGVNEPLDNPSEVKHNAQYIGSIRLSNAAGTAVQKAVFSFRPKHRHGSPFVGNLSGVALGATAADHEIRITPIEETVED